MALGGAEFEARFRAFEEKHEKDGVRQFHRVLRQKLTNDQALDLLRNERGTDPVTGLAIEVIDVGSEVETYDEALNQLLNRSLDEAAEVMELIAGCLWVYSNGDRAVRRDAAARRFQELLVTRGVESPSKTAMRRPAWDKDRIVSLNATFSHPMAKPLFLRNLDARVIASVTYGDLLDKTFLYLDWKRFVELVTEVGARFTWSSEKTARRVRAMRAVERPPIVAGKVPEVHVGPVRMFLTDPSLVQMYFDGTTPRTTVKKMIAAAEHVQSARPNQESPPQGRRITL